MEKYDKLSVVVSLYNLPIAMKQKVINVYKKNQKKIRKKSQFIVRHPYIVPVSTFLGLFITGIVLFFFLGGTTQGAADARIVNVFVDGEQQTVTTRADTVGELIEKLELGLVPEDIVEPHRESPIIENDTQINVYRARPVKVVDGDRVFTILSAQRAPRLVVAEAGLDLLPEDEAVFERLDLNILDTSVSEQLIVVRSVPMQMSVYGAIKTLRTTAQTVGELLAEQGVEPGGDDTTEPGLDTRITPGMFVAVNRPGVKTIAVNEPIPFETERVNDDTIVAGQSKVDREGLDGERAVIYEIIEQDGVEISRTQIQTVVLRESVSKRILSGTKIVTPTFSSSVTVAGDKAALMAAAGIAESDFAYADFIIANESGWRPGAANSSSGAYGLCQSLPASKMASAGPDYLTNPVTQLRWCSGYAAGRYGGWSGAYNAWQAQGWW